MPFFSNKDISPILILQINNFVGSGVIDSCSFELEVDKLYYSAFYRAYTTEQLKLRLTERIVMT